MAYIVNDPVTVKLLQRAAQAAYQGNNALALRLLTSNGLTYDDLRSYLVAKGGMSPLNGLGASVPTPVPAPAPAAAPADTSSLPIDQQLNAVSIDWSSGTLWVGTNHYSLLTTLLGAVVVKGIMWGGSKVAKHVSSKFSGEKTDAKPARSNPRRRNPLFGLVPKVGLQRPKVITLADGSKILEPFGNPRGRARRNGLFDLPGPKEPGTVVLADDRRIVLPLSNPRGRGRRNPAFLAYMLPKLASGGVAAVGQYGVTKALTPKQKLKAEHRSERRSRRA